MTTLRPPPSAMLLSSTQTLGKFEAKWQVLKKKSSRKIPR